jgi:hypothetical protein
MATEKFANSASSTLSGGIGSGDGSLVVTSAALFPATPQFRIICENEIMLVTGVAGTTFSVDRGQEGTVATSHGDGFTVTHILTAGALTQLKTDAFSPGGDLSGSATSQTIAALAVTDAKVAVANKDGLVGTPSMRTLGTGAQQACAGDDSRLSNTRTPSSHASNHQHSGGDEVATATAAANAIPKAGGAGTLAIGWVPTSAGAPSAVAPTGSGGSGSNVSFSNHAHAAMPFPGGAPYGFENRTDSEIFFTDGTLEFLIQPKSPATSWSMWAGLNTKVTKSAAETLVITNTVGPHFIYYTAGGVLSESPSFPGFSSIFVALIYWDGAKSLGLADERHQVTMDYATHGYLHNTVGTRYQTGFTLQQLTINTSGVVDTDAQVSLDAGTIWDEDIQISITRAAAPTLPFQQELGLTTTVAGKFPIYYRTGASGTWTKDPATNFPVRSWNGVAGQRIGYNRNNVGTWSVADPGTNGNYVAAWIVATDSTVEPVIAIMGQRFDTTQTNAQNNNIWDTLSFGTLPFQEMKVLFRLIYRTDATFTNAPRAYVVGVQDLRNVSNLPSGTYVATDHNSLAGRSVVATHPATAVSVDTTPFTNAILTVTETDVQLAFDAIAGKVKMGAGSPESVVTAPVGSLYLRTDGSAGTTFYLKETGASNTGWVAARAVLAHASSHQNGGSDEIATATAAANAIPKAGAGGTLAIGWLPTGTSSTTVCIGDDSRLSNDRAPTAHASSHQNGGGDEIATATAGANAIPKAGGTGVLAIGWIPTGATSTTVCLGDDSRLSNNRAPTSHASNHQNGGGDEVATSSAAANAIPKAGGTGVLDIGWLPTDARIVAAPNLGASVIGNGATVYLMPDLTTGVATEVAALLCTKAGTIRDLFVYMVTGPTTSESITFTVRKNSVGSSLTVTVSNPAQSGSDTTNTVSVAAGDRISIEAIASAGGAVADVIASFNYVV